ncbi:MAG TPA: DoxX family protein [Candidatus Acidoferrum sp.]|nr:DoxX family protein [Candidatus Acidoferrum sp.]
MRLMVGAAFAIHGLPKIEHPTTWMDGTRSAGAFAPWLQAISAGAEFFGGIALFIGFASQLATALICFDMFIATFIVEIPSGARFSVGAKPFELPLVYFSLTLALFLLGPGNFSVDSWIRTVRSLKQPRIRSLERTS